MQLRSQFSSGIHSLFSDHYEKGPAIKTAFARSYAVDVLNLGWPIRAITALQFYVLVKAGRTQHQGVLLSIVQANTYSTLYSLSRHFSGHHRFKLCNFCLSVPSWSYPSEVGQHVLLSPDPYVGLQ